MRMAVVLTSTASFVTVPNAFVSVAERMVSVPEWVSSVGTMIGVRMHVRVYAHMMPLHGIQSAVDDV